MTQVARRDRVRADTDREIRAAARTLLVEHGQAAVTLRAIARELGITAPALYRYYDSLDDLLRHLCEDICADLAADLVDQLAALPERSPVQQFFAACRGFRRWSLAHPREFSLVFASPAPQLDTIELCNDPFGAVFLGIAGKVLAQHRLDLPHRPLSGPLADGLRAGRVQLLELLSLHGTTLDQDAISLTTMYFVVQFWIKLYGHVALEVFGRCPMIGDDPEPLFDTMLNDLAAEAGLA